MKITRRNLLKLGLGFSAVYLDPYRLVNSLASPVKSGNNSLVVIQLLGGNDGLNTVIPYANGKYYDLRPRIGIKANEVLKLDSNVGFHPNLSALAKLYDEKKLAIIQGCGYENPNLSHFRSLEIWQTANPDKLLPTGWLGRYIDEVNQSGNPFPGINLDFTLPKSLIANSTIIPSISNFKDFHLDNDAHYPDDNKAHIDAFKNMYQNFESKNNDLSIIKKTGLDALSASFKIPQMASKYNVLAKYPKGEFANKLKFMACLIANSASGKVYNLSLGGFDTHVNQINQQAHLLNELSDSLFAFHKDLEAHSVSDKVITVIFSEFGRRPSQNDGQGTDHGTSQPVMVIGSKVKGGLYGQYPSLTDLDNGNLKHEVDFRCVYASILDKWLNVDSSLILGKNFENIDFV